MNDSVKNIGKKERKDFVVKMKNILKELESNFDSDEYRVGGAASEQEISRAEKMLNVQFPQSYKIFLNEIGWMEVFNAYFFGIPSEEDGEGSVIRMTDFARVNWGLPNNYIVVYSSEDKILWCLDCNDANDPTVQGYDTQKKKFVSKVSENFESMIFEYLDQSD